MSGRTKVSTAAPHPVEYRFVGKDWSTPWRPMPAGGIVSEAAKAERLHGGTFNLEICRPSPPTRGRKA